MDTNKRFNSIEETLAEVLIEMQELKQGQQTMIKAFDRFGEKVIDKLTELTTEVRGVRQELKQLQDHEERIRKIEEIVFRRGA